MHCRALLLREAIVLALLWAHAPEAFAQPHGTPADGVPEPPVPHEVRSRLPPLEAAKGQLIEFDAAPFPYNGRVPSTGRPFFDVVDAVGRRGHRSQRAGILWEDLTYSDRRSLLFIPKGFDARRPGLIVVFLHGNRARLERDVSERQRVARQISEANINAVLVAPQLAVDANDSSAGLFWERFGFARFLGEAGAHLAKLYGDRHSRATFATLPVVIIAYSGGFLPAAWALQEGGTGRRVVGVVLLDALYGEIDKYALWIDHRRSGFFLSAYTASSARGNGALMRTLAQRHVPFSTTLPARLEGTVTFLAAGAGVDHETFVTAAWAPNPIGEVLERMAGYARAPRKDPAPGLGASGLGASGLGASGLGASR